MFDHSLERHWATRPQSPKLPRAESLPTSLRCPSRLEPRQEPRLRSPPTKECLIRVCSDQPVQRGQPVTVEVKLSRSVLSELRRPTGLTHDPKYDKKAALLVAIDTERLRALGQGHGLRPLQAARRRLLAQEALCAPRARLHEGQSQTQLQLQLEPRELPGRESVVLLQVVVEAVIDKVHWIHFGRLVPVRIAAPVEGEAQEALA
mmetsp:Transcript_72319/g.223456  ORF Transcript_72319/g.223456 Transcript_72319/m.223456 type:complete len:205 (-) Transcript_72319:127-741(-)